jgi:hypothetical protein
MCSLNYVTIPLSSPQPELGHAVCSSGPLAQVGIDYTTSSCTTHEWHMSDTRHMTHNMWQRLNETTHDLHHTRVTHNTQHTGTAIWHDNETTHEDESLRWDGPIICFFLILSYYSTNTLFTTFCKFDGTATTFSNLKQICSNMRNSCFQDSHHYY